MGELANAQSLPFGTMIVALFRSLEKGRASKATRDHQRRRWDSNPRIKDLQSFALATWPRRLHVLRAGQRLTVAQAEQVRKPVLFRQARPSSKTLSCSKRIQSLIPFYSAESGPSLSTNQKNARQLRGCQAFGVSGAKFSTSSKLDQGQLHLSRPKPSRTIVR